MIDVAKNIGKKLNCDYIARNKISINKLIRVYNDSFLVIGKDRIELFNQGQEQPFFFHPNSSLFRIKRIKAGINDPLICISQLQKGDTFLDCTLGIGSDAIVASYVVGELGKVVGVESNKYISFLVKEGLQNYVYDIDYDIESSLRRIEVVNENNLNYLQNLDNNSFDVVYFDPMFSKAIEESNGINMIRNFANYSDITKKLFDEAYRVAKRRVVLKEYYKSNLFQDFKMNVDIRKTSEFHFGYIDKLR
jgi:ubiquinone/menaquinone biosynthesis C-methylase UbiE